MPDGDNTHKKLNGRYRQAEKLFHEETVPLDSVSNEVMKKLIQRIKTHEQNIVDLVDLHLEAIGNVPLVVI